MKKILYSAAILLSLVACDTPKGVIGNPENNTDTSGTTGSANMTNNNNNVPVTKDPPGTAQDSTLARKDTIPRIPR
jgi:hypothetical protein